MLESVCPCCHGTGRIVAAEVAEPDWSIATLFTLDPLLEGRIEIQQDTGCWVWNGATQRSGSNGKGIYGRLKRGGRLWYIHRWVYQLMVGAIPDGHDVHHRVEAECSSTLCCNPRHLEDIEKAEHEWLHREIAQYGEAAA